MMWLLLIFCMISASASTLEPSIPPTVLHLSVNPSLTPAAKLIMTLVPSQIATSEQSQYTPTSAPSNEQVTGVPSFIESNELSSHPSQLNLTASENPSMIQTKQPSFDQNPSLVPSQIPSISNEPSHLLTTSVPSETKVTVKPSFSGSPTRRPSFHQNPSLEPSTSSNEPSHLSSTRAPSWSQETGAPSGRPNSEPSNQPSPRLNSTFTNHPSTIDVNPTLDPGTIEPSQLKSTTVPSTTPKATEVPSFLGTSNPVEFPSIRPEKELSSSPSTHVSPSPSNPPLFMYSKSRKSKKKSTKTKKSNSSKAPKVKSFKKPKVKLQKMPKFKSKSSKTPKSKSTKHDKTIKKVKSSILPQVVHNGADSESPAFQAPPQEAIPTMSSSTNDTFTNTIVMSITSSSYYSSPEYVTASTYLIGASLPFFAVPFLLSVTLWL